MVTDWISKLIGMNTTKASEVIEKHGYMSAFFGPGEAIKTEDLDRSYDWFVVIYDKNNKVIEVHEA